METYSPRSVLLQQILALGLKNPVSSYDVDADDVLAYFDETDLPTVNGFKEWLAAE